MSLLDAVIVALLTSVGVWSLVAADVARGARRLALLGLAGLLLVQLLIEGFYWQLAPAYLLIAVMALAVLPPRAATRRKRRLPLVFGQLGLIALVLLAIAPWMLFLPVPRLPAPTGEFAVGTTIWRWQDDSRPETLTSDPADRRNVIVQAWYPAQPGASGPHSSYIDGVGDLPPSVSLIPKFVMAHYDRIDTHAIVDAPVSSARSSWPVVIFLNGYGAPRAYYTSVVADLASRGYVVLGVDHPYESAVTQLADGRIVATVEAFAEDDPDRLQFMADRQSLRVADVSFVIDQLSRPERVGARFVGRLDLDRVAATGHSLGGATAAAAMDVDGRIKAAANIDGTLYGQISGQRTDRPFLLLESEHIGSSHSQRFEDGNQLFFDQFAGDYRYEISRANHFSFTDALLFLSPPARWGASLLIGGGRGPRETHRITVDVLEAFLQEPLTGTRGDIVAAVTRYPGVYGPDDVQRN